MYHPSLHAGSVMRVRQASNLQTKRPYVQRNLSIFRG
jgi:hypothetical protein